MQPLQLVAEDPFRLWAFRFSRDSQSAEPTHLCLKVGVCLLMGGWGGEFYPNPFLLIRGLDSRRTLANGCRRPPGRGDILGAAPGRQSSGLCAGLGGDWGQTPWAHPLVLHASRKPALFPAAAAHFLFFIVVVLSVRVIGVEQRCFNLTAAPI